MSKLLWGMLAVVVTASPAAAQTKSVRTSLGYTFAQYLEEGGGSAPLGLYLSLASTSPIGFEADVAYHRDTEEISVFSFSETITLNTFTMMVGPRFASASAQEGQPFFHLLGGARYDSIEGFGNNWSFGLGIGGGVDIAAGSSAFIRLGADFQIFFDEGEDFKVLRLSAGVAF